MSKNKRQRGGAAPAEIIDLGLGENSDHREAFQDTASKEPDSPAKSVGSIKTRLTDALRGRWWAVGLVAVLALSALGGTLKYLEEDAQRQMAGRQRTGPVNQKDEPLLSKVNPFLSAPPPATTPQLSKEFVYSGGKMLSVVDAGATPAVPVDLAVFRPGNGAWYVMGPNSTVAASAGWGASGDLTEAGDYDGDGKTDFAVYRPGTSASPDSYWYILKSSDPSGASYIIQGFGSYGDIAVPADYDGDHKTDIAVYRPSVGTWFVLRSSDATIQYIYYGNSTDIPAPADYDGDGKADAAVFRQTNSTYYMKRSSDGGTAGVQLSTTINSGQPVPGDYDGDGKADYAMRNGADWIVQSSVTGNTQSVTWYSSADVAVQNDYDGDGKVDIAVWRGEALGGFSAGTWFIRQSSHLGQANELRTEGWGTRFDIPVPALWKR